LAVFFHFASQHSGEPHRLLLPFPTPLNNGHFPEAKNSKWQKIAKVKNLTSINIAILKLTKNIIML
jgi:hypothetical protein